MAKRIQFGNNYIDIPELPNHIGLIIGGLLLFFMSFSAFYTVDANENGVVLFFGKYSRTTGPGFHFKLPFGIERVYKVKVDFQYKQEFGFRTNVPGRRTQYSSSNYGNESWMLTGDLNIAAVEWIVQYKIKDPKDYLFSVRDVENTIHDVSEAALRLMIGDRSFTEVIQKDRVIIADNTRQYMQKILDNYNSGISIKMVQLQSVLPPEPVADSYNEVVRAEQEEEKLENEANQAFNKEIFRADGEAKQMINEAKGYAVERVNNAKGEAVLFELVLAEYNKAPQITKDRYYIEKMNDIYSKTANKVIVDTRLENFLPMLNLNKKESK